MVSDIYPATEDLGWQAGVSAGSSIALGDFMDNFWQGKRVLITGGTGFLAKHLIDALLNRKVKLRIIDVRKPIREIAGVDYIEIDIRNKEKINELCFNTDILFHLASIPSVADAPPSIYYEINVKGTQNILEGALKNNIKKLIYVSSSSVYGVPSEFPLKESSPLKPVGAYGRTKLHAENLCREFIKAGLNISILRPRVLVGPGRIGIFSILFDRIIANKTIYMMGQGDNIFQFINIFDMVSACLLVAEHPGTHLFNIGSEHILPVKDEMSGLIKYARSHSRIKSIPSFPAKYLLKILSALNLSPLVEEQFAICDKNFKLDTQLAQKTLNWRPLYSDMDSLIQAFEWYVHHLSNEKKQYRCVLDVLGKFDHYQMGGFQDSIT